MESDNPLSQAITAHQHGKLDEAEHLYREILKIEPKHPATNHNLGILINSLNKTTDALELFKIAAEENPNIEQYWISYFTALIKENKLDVAEVVCKKALEFNPDSAEAYNSLGIIFNKFLKLDEAEGSFKKAIALKKNSIEFYNNLAATQHMLHKSNDAISNYKKSIELKPDHAVTYYNQGITFFDLGKQVESETSYRKAIKLKPDYAEAYNNLASSLYISGKLDEALIMYNKAISLKPNFKIAIQSRGHVLFDKKNFNDSLRDFDICNTEESRARSLASLYALGRIDEIYKRIEDNSDLDKKNLSVAAFSSFISYKEKKDTTHKFCNNPMDFISFSNLSSNFEDSNLFINDVINELKYIKTSWEPFGRTTHNGYHSGNDFNIFKNPTKNINNLKSIILKEIDLYHSKFKNKICSFIQKWPLKKELISWYIILKQQGYQEDHIHPSAWLSGVIYLKVVPPLKKNEGAIEFSLNSKNYSHSNSLKFIHQPKAGDIVFFPSSLHHITIPFTTDTDRIIISFDMKPK